MEPGRRGDERCRNLGGEEVGTWEEMGRYLGRRGDGNLEGKW